MRINIQFWNEIIPELKYRQYQKFEYSKRKRNQIIDNVLSHGYSIMLRQYTEQLTIYISKGRFSQS